MLDLPFLAAPALGVLVFFGGAENFAYFASVYTAVVDCLLTVKKKKKKKKRMGQFSRLS
jgi:hypothetical protein